MPQRTSRASLAASPSPPAISKSIQNDSAQGKSNTLSPRTQFRKLNGPREHHMLPRGLVEDIQQFQVEDFAKRYFSTHRAGFLFRRRIPVEQLMTWQKVCPSFSVLSQRLALPARRSSGPTHPFPSLLISPSSGATPTSTPRPKPKSTQGCSQDIQGDTTHHGRP